MKKLIEEYLDAKQKLNYYKSVESQLRIQLLNKAFPDTPIGTNNRTYKQYNIKGIFKNNFTLNAKQLDKNYDSLTEAEKACINYKPNLLMSAYNELEPEEKQNLDNFITVKPAMPTLSIEIEEPIEN